LGRVDGGEGAVFWVYDYVHSRRLCESPRLGEDRIGLADLGGGSRWLVCDAAWADSVLERVRNSIGLCVKSMQYLGRIFERIVFMIKPYSTSIKSERKDC
jgi:hypothetical protein